MVKADSIPRQDVFASDLPDVFTAKVIGVKDKDDVGGPLLNNSNRPIVKIMVRDTNDDKENIVTYSVPKALTGKGQLDILFYRMEKMGLPKDTQALVGKTFVWERADLPGEIRGNSRHYPKSLVKEEVSSS